MLCNVYFLQLNDWLSGSKVVKVIRFLGTTPDSSDIELLLTSTIRQLKIAFGRSLTDFEKSTKDFQSLSKLFKEYVNNLTVYLEQKVSLVIEPLCRDGESVHLNTPCFTNFGAS